MIKYNDETHTYELDGKKLKSVTEIATDIAGINKDYLNQHQQQAAADGTDAHSELARYYDTTDNFSVKDFTTELGKKISEYIEPNKDMLTEQIVWNAEKGYAGTIDLLVKKGLTIYYIRDWKTGKNPNKKYCQIQLSLYKLALEFMGYDCTDTILEVINPDGIIPIEALSWEEILDLQKSELDPRNPEELEAMQNKLLELKPYVVQYEEIQNKLKENLLEQMESAGATNYFGSVFNATYVKPTKSLRIDSTKLKKELPDIFDAYAKVSETKGYIKLNETKD